jgi:hypothetical protein
MGNNPSTPATGHPPSSSSKPQTPAPTESAATSPRTLRNPHRSPITIGHTSHALAAPPEPSNAYAHGRSVPTRAGFSHLQQHHQQYQQHQQQHHGHPYQHPQGSGSGASPSQSPHQAQGVPGAAGPAPKTVPVAIPDATRPVDVPHAATTGVVPHTVPTGAEFDAQHANREDPLASDLNSTMLPSNSISDLSYLTRPPRLPLPIEEELKTPGSPGNGPTEVNEIIDDEGDILAAKPAAAVEDDAAAREDQMTRKSSGATADTVDDDLAGDWDGGDGTTGHRQTVPTRLEWLGGGDKVWVTGTIFQWKRKQRLHPIEGKPGCFADTINVVTGTHHIRFLVDGVMTTSEHMPTTVDLANNLVNYMVVSADDADKKAREDAAVESRRDSTVESDDQEEAKRPKTRPVHPSHQYLNPIPQYLTDFDQPEESSAYQYAVRVMDKLPPPPTLPGFLAKPILNAPTLVREDNSVLILPPNHTVLNHLATCSIKNNILSVSATTRYKAKVSTRL